MTITTAPIFEVAKIADLSPGDLFCTSSDGLNELSLFFLQTQEMGAKTHRVVISTNSDDLEFTLAGREFWPDEDVLRIPTPELRVDKFGGDGSFSSFVTLEDAELGQILFTSQGPGLVSETKGRDGTKLLFGLANGEILRSVNTAVPWPSASDWSLVQGLGVSSVVIHSRTTS